MTTPAHRLRRGALVLAAAMLIGSETPVAAVGDLVLVSRPNGPTGAADGYSADPSISADGRFVAFSSDADNLSPDDRDGTWDIYVRDLAANTTTLVSRASGAGGAAGNGASTEPAISADGRFVAFTSRASNFTAGADRGIRYVFVRDLQETTTALVSRGPGPAGGVATLASFAPSITADGRVVAFHSHSGDLAGEPTSGGMTYVRDLRTGAVRIASRLDGPAGAPVPGSTPSISADGRHVAFVSSFIAHPGASRFGNVFLRDLDAGTTRLISGPPAGAPADGPSLNPSVSGDGRFVAFESAASNLSAQDLDTEFAPDVFVRDVGAATTSLVSEGDISGHAVLPEISASGRHVSFTVYPYAVTGPLGVYARDVAGGPPMLLSAVNDPSKAPSAALVGRSAISADGRYVAFAAPSAGLVDDVPAHGAILRRDVLGPPPGAPAPVCGPAFERAAPGDGSSAQARFTLTRAQLLINQRIAQAAIRRLNAVQARLDAGLAAPDFCGHAIGAEDLDPAIPTTVAAASLAPAAPPTPAPVRPAPAGGGDPAAVRLTAAQLLINQRIGQAAVRRANGLAARLEEGLTGGDVLDGQVSQGKLADRLQVTSAPATPAPEPSRTVIPPRAGPPDPGSVRLSLAQLRINQRVYQAAVRRANALVARLEAGVTGTEVRDGSLTAADLAAGVVGEGS